MSQLTRKEIKERLSKAKKENKNVDENLPHEVQIALLNQDSSYFKLAIYGLGIALFITICSAINGFRYLDAKIEHKMDYVNVRIDEGVESNINALDSRIEKRLESLNLRIDSVIQKNIDTQIYIEHILSDKKISDKQRK